MKLDHTTNEEAITVVTGTSLAPLGVDTGEQMLETISTEKAQASLGDMSLPLVGQFLESSSEVEEQLPRLAREEVEAGPTQDMSHLTDVAHVEEAFYPMRPCRKYTPLGAPARTRTR
eukprot:Gb_22533 [translate_table: standard]